ncbi:triple tyrosine motif-containing protein [Edaphobacter aggregans]|uniref:triple tyrosine motif-containing protein n=1 Tax=Edaphobacter aggregans TaxID=570835 RepID=UPI000A017364
MGRCSLVAPNANSHKNHYRYMLENFEHAWNEVGSRQRLTTYTNLGPGKYVFRVQGSNGDGVWNGRRGVAHHCDHGPPGGIHGGFVRYAASSSPRCCGRPTDGACGKCIISSR